jgi:hypothetical protein
MAAAATIAFAVGMASVARAQDNPNEQQKHPANERVEKGAPGEAARPRTDADRKTPAAADQTGQAEPKREGETRAGQAEPEKRVEDKRAVGANAPEKRAEDKQTGQIERKDNNAGERANRVRVEGNVHISQERAARISAELIRRGRPENVNVAVEVGGRLPEEVALEPVPAEILEIAPEYRGYDYVYVDGRIVFVQPSSREIIGMIDVADNAVVENDDAQPRLARAKPCPVD